MTGSVGIGIGLKLSGGLGGVTYPSRPISNRTSIRDFQSAQSSTYRHDCRIRHRIAASGGKSFTLRYVGWLFQAGSVGDKVQTPTTKIIDEVYVEYPVGVMTQVTFNTAKGLAGGWTMNPWDDVESDPIAINPAAGDFVYEQNSYRQTGTNTFDCPLTVSTNLGEYSTFRVSASFGSAASYATGTGSALPLAVTAQAWGAVGMYAKVNKPAFFIFGDSVDDGAGGGTGGGDQSFAHSVQDPGFLGRMITAAGYPYIRFTCPSAVMSAGINALNCLNLTKGQVKYGIIGLGINEVFGGATLATIQARYAAIATNLRQAGCRYVFVRKLFPATDNLPVADGYISYTNQQVRSTESVRLSTNAWLDTNPAIFDGIIDTSLALDPTHLDLWPVNGTTPQPVVDGTHPGTAMNDRAAAACQSAFNALIAAKEALGGGSGGLGTALNARPAAPTKKTAQFCFGTVASYQYWQTIDGTITTPIGLTDWSTNTSSGWTATRGAQAFSSVPNSNGVTSNGNYAAFPDQAMLSYGRTTVTPNVYTIAGLNPAKTYNLAMLAGGNGAGFDTNFTVVGAVTSGPTTAVALNNTTPTHFDNIAPDGSGNLTISIVRAAGATFGCVNAFQLQEN